MTPRGDMEIGAIVMVGDGNWRRGPKCRVVTAWLFGRRERIEHLGMVLQVIWWREEPFLRSISEVR